MYNQVNKTLYFSALVFLLSTSIFVACQTKQEKSADENAEETKTAIKDVKSETTVSDWTPFKESAEKTIANNDERIKVLKDKIKKSNTPNLDKLRAKRIDDLEDQNTQLRAKIAEYKEENVTTLAQFKTDIQKQLDKIEQELKDLDK